MQSRCSCKHLSDLCDDELGVIFSFFDESDLFKMGLVCKRWRKVSSENFLWVKFPKFPDYFEPRNIKGNELKFRNVWIQEKFPESLKELGHVGRLSDESIEFIFSYLDTDELFRMGSICKRARKISCSRNLWGYREIETEFSELADKERERERKEREEDAIDLPDQPLKRMQYMYHLTFPKRTQEQGLQKLYRIHVRNFSYFKFQYFFQNCFPLSITCPLILSFLISTICFLSLLLYFIGEDEEERDNTFCIFSIIISGTSVPVILIFAGLLWVFKFLCHDGSISRARYLHNIPLGGTDYQKEMLAIMLEKKGIRGKRWLGASMEAIYEREEKLQMKIVVPALIFGTILNYIIFCVLSCVLVDYIMGYVFLYILFTVMLIVFIITNPILWKTIFLTKDLLCMQNSFDKLSSNYLFKGNFLEKVSILCVSYKNARLCSHFFIMQLFWFSMMMIVLVTSFWMTIEDNVDGVFYFTVVPTLWIVVAVVLGLFPAIIIVVRIVQGFLLQKFGEFEWKNLLPGFPVLDISACLLSYLVGLCLVGFLVLFHSLSFFFVDGEQIWIACIPFLFMSVSLLSLFVLVTVLFCVYRKCFPVDMDEKKEYPGVAAVTVII